MARIYVNAGKAEGFFAGNLIDMLNHTVEGKRVDVGRIDLMPGYSLFDVPKADAQRVVKGLTGADFAGKRIYSEIAEPDKDYARASTRKKSAAENAAAEEETTYDYFMRRGRSASRKPKATSRSTTRKRK